MPGVKKTHIKDKKQLGSQADDKQQAGVDSVSKPRPPSTDAEGVVGQAAREQEPIQAPESALVEIEERFKDADRKAEKEVKEVAGEEAGLREPEPQIPPDVADAGVRSPETEATEIIEKGGTFDLPISEKVYEEGQHTKITSKVNVKREVFGVKSIVALALFVGRMIKRAHHLAKSVRFKGEK